MLIGIVLGVASVVAVHLISVRINDSLSAATPAYLSELTFLADRPGLTTADYFTLRKAWRSGDHPEIAGMVPVLEGQLRLGDVSVSVVGIDAFSGLRTALPLAGLAPRGVIASSELMAQLGHLESGAASGLALPLPGEFARFEVNAIGAVGNQRILLTDLGPAQELLQLPTDALSRVGLKVTHPWLTVERLLNRLLPGFGAGFDNFAWSLSDWRIRSIDSELPSRAFGQSVLFNLGALGSLALVVSWLLVYQVGLIWLRRRRRTMEMLHFQGVTLDELRRGFLVSLVPLSVLATVLGIGGGVALAALLSRISTTGMDLPLEPVALDAWLLGKATLSGLGVSVVGAWLAFQQEWARPLLPQRWWVAVLPLLLLAGALGVWWVSALWGAFLAIVTLCLASVLLVQPTLRRLSGTARRLPGFSLLARIGARELVWYPRDLAVAVAALMLAVATSMAIALMVDSFRQDFSRMLDLRLADDVYVRSAGRDLRSLAETVMDSVEGPAASADKPAATATGTVVVPSGQLLVRVDDLPVEVGYAVFDRAQTARYGLVDALQPGQAIASERLLRNLGRSVGDRLDVAGSGITIVASFPGFGDVMPRLLVDVATAQQMPGVLIFDRLAIRAAQPELIVDLLAARFPDLEVQQALPLRIRALEIFDQTFAITRALTLLALLVACIGLYNALLGLRLNQQSTLLLLASMGVSDAEVRRIQLARGLGIGAAVLVFALPLGLIMGWLLCHVVNPRAFGWELDLVIAPSALAVPVVLGLLVIVVTSLLPAPGEKLVEKA